MSTFLLEIITPDGILYKEEVNEVILPTSNGQITILPHHIPLFAKLGQGEARITKNGKETLIAVLGGVVEVGKNMVCILSDYAIEADTIVMAKAEEAKKRAEDAIKNKQSNEDFALLDKELQKSLLELKVGQRVKKRSSQPV